MWMDGKLMKRKYFPRVKLVNCLVIVMDSFEVINKGWAQDTTTGKKKTYHQNSQNDYQVVFKSFVFFS